MEAEVNSDSLGDAASLESALSQPLADSKTSTDSMENGEVLQLLV